MTEDRRRQVGPLPGALALLILPLSACTPVPANAAPPPPQPEPIAEPSMEPVEVVPAPEPEIVIAQLDVEQDQAPEPQVEAPATAPPAAASPAAADDETDSDDAVAAARKKLQSYLDATASLKATFRSVLLDERKVAVAESSGVVMVKRPHRFRWEYQEPTPSLILADGERLWSYDAELEQAVVRKLSDLEGANPSNLLGGDTRVDEDFDVLGAYRSDTIEWIELRPRGQSDFTRVRLGFADQKIELMEMHDQLGQVTQIALSDLEANADLDDALFQFEPPEGTDVVGAD